MRQLTLLFFFSTLIFSCKKKEPDPVAPTPIKLIEPLRLGMYFGKPDEVNGSAQDANKAAEHFAKFDILVLGDSFYSYQHPWRGNTILTIKKTKELNPDIAIYGQLLIGDSKGLTENQLKLAMSDWHAIGATGIFVQDCGYERFTNILGTDKAAIRRRQNFVFDHAHHLSMPVIVTSDNIDDVLKDEDGIASSLGADDYYLLEHLLLKNAQYFPMNTFYDRATAANEYRKSKNIKIAATSTITSTKIYSTSSSSREYKFAWCGIAMCNFEAFQFTDVKYSATNNKLYPYSAYTPWYGSEWKDNWIQKTDDSHYQRRSEVAILKVEGNNTYGEGDFVQY